MERWAVYAVVRVVMALMLWPLVRVRIQDRRRPKGRHGRAIDRRGRLIFPRTAPCRRTGRGEGFPGGLIPRRARPTQPRRGSSPRPRPAFFPERSET
jgi:hypothetical protein